MCIGKHPRPLYRVEETLLDHISDIICPICGQEGFPGDRLLPAKRPSLIIILGHQGPYTKYMIALLGLFSGVAVLNWALYQIQDDHHASFISMTTIVSLISVIG